MAIVKLKKVYDGWANLLTGLGVSGKDKRMSNEVYWTRMDQVTCEQMYAGDDTAAAVADLLPEEAMRAGIKLKNIDKQTESKLISEVESLEIDERLDEAWKLARVYGGAGVLMVVDDGLDLMEPLDPMRVRRLQSLVIFNRWELMPVDIDDDITSKTFGLPLTYQISPQSTASVNFQKVHRSRFLIFEGVKLPRRLFVTNNYWGDSVFNRLENSLRNYNSVHDSSASVMQDFTTDVFKMKNLAELVAAGRENDIKTRIELANMSKSVLKAVVLDLEEDYEVKARSLAGVTDVISKADERLTAAARMPHTLLFGSSPSGLGATGRSEERGWYDFVARQQNLVLKRKYNLLLPIVATNAGVVLPQEWSWEFNPLFQLTEKEDAELRKSVAETDAIYIDRGVLDPSEVTASRFGGEDYSMDTVVDEQARTASKNQTTEIV